MITNTVNIRWLGQKAYLPCWQAMQQFTRDRHEDTIDELWLLEHEPVFTQGQNGRPEHVLNPGDIPIVQTDRGGQVTYHGPGQLMIYTLIDVKRKQLTIRELLSKLEQSIVDMLAQFNILAKTKREAPGVYVSDQKICSVGLRIRRGCAYHGLAFNIAMDLEPFTRIHPCGFTALKMTQFKEWGGLQDTYASGRKLINHLMKHLGYTNATFHLTDVDLTQSEQINGNEIDRSS